MKKAAPALPRHIGEPEVQTYVDSADILGTLGMKYHARSRGCAGMSVLYAVDADSKDSGGDLSATLDGMEAAGYVS